jgi:hypothetical protein
MNEYALFLIAKTTVRDSPMNPEPGSGFGLFI